MKTVNILISGFFFLSFVARAGDSIDFNRDIRPIISENCVHCHGPDEDSREAGLRLDTAEGAYFDLGGYQAVVPHDPDNSELWLRVDLEADDPDVMPPRKSKRVLTAEQKDLLKRWIESGGRYDEHWAFVPPKKPEVPGGEASAIDTFISRKLEEKGLSPSPLASPEKLIRRVSLDLIGIPPSPEEVSVFTTAYSTDPEQAWRNLVDRLLASPRFGERWARPWLDLARYADSNGFQADQLRDSWAYRDWVIRALNDGMPFDQFSIEQLAGDLLPDATVDQKIATGFHRTVTCNVEAGVHPEENRTNQVADRVNTTGTVWMGVTMECAQCHAHKYDPFTMEDYYGLFAYFNNTPLEVSEPSGETDVSHDFIGPFMDLPQSEEMIAKRNEIQGEMARLNREKKALNTEEKFAAWKDEVMVKSGAPPKWNVMDISSFETAGNETHEILEDQSVLVTGPMPTQTTFTISVKSPTTTINGIRLEALTHDRLPGRGPGRGDAKRTNFVLTDFVMLVDGKPVELINARAGFSQTGWPVANAIDDDPVGTGWAIAPEFGKDHWATFQTAQPLSLKSGSRVQFVLDQQYRGGRTLGRVRLLASEEIPQSDDMDPELFALLKKDTLNNREKKKLQELFESSQPEIATLNKKTRALSNKLNQLKPDQTLIMEELEKPRMTHVMNRGDYLDKGEPVSPGTPAIFAPVSPDLPKNRLGLAKWLVSEDNPLVARVTVNRWWAEIFGRGIVKTVEDFGTQSEPPTHPELLDWLAVEFIESGWSQKHILREIVMSRTYRQSSAITATHREVDPDNRYLARAPRFRMDAERIRDNALAVSGLLSEKMFGKPIMPYQPPGIWRQVGRNEPKWEENENEDRWRRGIYIVYRRAAPYPSMVNFDAPDRGSCVVARPRTNTPLQALTLINDPAYLEMALAFADRILGESPSKDPGERIDRAFQIAFSRNATPDEIRHLRKVLDERLTHFKVDPEAANELLRNVSGYYQSTHRNRVELASWFYIGNILLNLDEMVTKS